MANEEHVRIIQQGYKEWSEWKTQNKDIRLDLYKAGLRGLKLPMIPNGIFW